MSHSSDMGGFVVGSHGDSGDVPIVDPRREPSGEAGVDASAASASSTSVPTNGRENVAREAASRHKGTAAHLAELVDLQELSGEAPAWLVSAIVHMAILIVLGLVLITQPRVGSLVLRLDPRDAGDDLQHGELDLPVALDEPSIEDTTALQPRAIESSYDADALADPLDTPVSPLGRVLQPNSPPIQLALSGREEGMREALLAAYGGTAATEEAVRRALSWLTRNQISRTGLWSLSGPYDDGVSPRTDNPDAATALALLAYQGAGYTPDSEDSDAFTKAVRRGWYALLQRQQSDGNFFQQGQAHGRFYTQAIATIAICELYGMTQNPEYREPAQLAVDYCVKMQTSEGGWRYYEHSGSDLSVTGWFVMALQSARMAGLDVPELTFRRIEKFLDSVSRDLGAQYAYLPSDGPRRSMTAEGLLCRQYLGWSRSDPNLIRGVSVLLDNLPSEGDREAYYWYYAAQVCHHMEGDAWRQWNSSMRTVVPALQVRTGRERGSWDPRGDKSVAMNNGGRLFITCLSTYMLEVYYRHLPLYQLDALHTVR